MIFYGILIDNSLYDKKILQQVRIEKTWVEDDWVLHRIILNEDKIISLQQSLNTGPWYVHLWSENKENIIVVFKEKIFHIKKSDKATWGDAIVFGMSIGIPEEQLDFLVP